MIRQFILYRQLNQLKKMDYQSLQGCSSSSKVLKSTSKKYIDISQPKRIPINQQITHYMTQQILPKKCSTQTFYFSNKTQNDGGQSQKQKERLMNFMREQIQIATVFYTKKMNGLLKQQAKYLIFLISHRCIAQLKNKLKENQTRLKQKDQIIAQLKSNKQSPKKKLGITAHSANLHNIYNKQIEQMNNQVNSLQETVKQLDEKIREKEQTQMKINTKIEYIEKMLMGFAVAKVGNCQKKLEKYISSREKQLQRLEVRASTFNSKGENTTIDNSPKNSIIDRTYNQISELRQNISNLYNKEFKYENYQINELDSLIKNLQNKIYQLEELTHYQMQQSKLNASQLKVTKGTFITRNDSNDDLSTISHHRSQPIHNRIAVSQKIMKQSELEVTRKSNPQKNNDIYTNFTQYDDVESFTDQEESDGDFEDFEEDMDEQLENNELRLRRVAENLGVKFPLEVEIDQTGYLKCVKDGMYLVDENHDGFYLTQVQIQYFCQKQLLKVYNQ